MVLPGLQRNELALLALSVAGRISKYVVDLPHRSRKCCKRAQDRSHNTGFRGDVPILSCLEDA